MAIFQSFTFATMVTGPHSNHLRLCCIFFNQTVSYYEVLRGLIQTIYPSVFNKDEVRKELDRLHDQYVLVPANKAGNKTQIVRHIILIAF